MTDVDSSIAPRDVAFADAVRVWARIGWLGFGGPAGQIALMHRELVEHRRWISDARFLHALNYCMLLPGPEAQQLAIYIGWLMHRTAGGIVAGVLFVLPGLLVMLVLSALYAVSREMPAIEAVFFGLKAAVLAIVVEAVLRIGRRALASRAMLAIASAAFGAIFLFDVPFPVIVVGAALIGLLGRHWMPSQFRPPADNATLADADYVVDRRIARNELTHVSPDARRAIRIVVCCLVVWWTPVAAVALLFGRDSLFAQQGVFFSQAAMLTFGGAYAVLAFVAQRVVDTLGWLQPREMLDGLALAETTPGPLILVVQFVAFIAAFHHAGTLPPLAAGVLAALLTSWVTFVPSFLWILVGAPYVEALRNNHAWHAALSSITAAVVGVVLNLAVWFALHALFAQVRDVAIGPLKLSVPQWTTLDPAAAVLSVASLIAMLRLKLGIGWTLLGAGVLGAAWRMLT